MLLSEIVDKPCTAYKGCTLGHQHTMQWIQTLNSKVMQIVRLYNIALPSNLDPPVAFHCMNQLRSTEDFV